jgi:uncharacterized 2Fe-2S/4Fe-4S cluster protein (DUF4445 family)
MEKFKVTFSPDNLTVEVSNDTTILSAAISCGIYINSACGGDGVCGRCKVKVKKGKVLTQPSGALSLEEKIKHIYLACITTIHSDAEIELPAESRLDFDKINPVELDSRIKGLYSESESVEFPVLPETKEFSDLPFTNKVYLELPVPNLDDRVSDLERILRQLRKSVDAPCVYSGLANIRQLGELLRDSDWKITVTLSRKEGAAEILFIEPGDTSLRNFGLAFDIGTTTVSCQLIDLVSSITLGTKVTYNRQAVFGSDVITRIIYAQQELGLEKLHNSIVDTLNQMIREFVAEQNIGLFEISCVICSGNTTMMHLLLNIDPTYIRREPYVPTANFIPPIRAIEAGININPRGMLYCLAGVSSYVGGDTTAGVLSSGLYKEEKICVLIDIGTNGEIALGNKEFIIAAAASAGPAFEGSGLTCGMRAGKGAIQKVKISPDDFTPTVETIGGIKPRGICGSGYIEIIASMLDCGLMDKSGLIKEISHRRIRNNETQREYVIAFKEEADTDQDIVITEADIENLKRAKAAIYSATAILARHMELDLSIVDKFYIAGGFGTSLNIDSAVKIGLLPNLERKKFQFIGNSSLAGSRAVLVSDEALKESENIARKITYFELSVDAGYMDEYMAALFFPHTDLSRWAT